MARIRALHDHHARVLPQCQRQLPVSDIDCIHLCDAVLQEHMREAASAAADVNGNRASNVDVELLQGVLELHAGPISSLNISGCEIGSGGAKRIAAIIPKCK